MKAKSLAICGAFLLSVKQMFFLQLKPYLYNNKPINLNMKKLLLTLLTLLSIQLQAQCWKDVKCGTTHTIALEENGTLWAWGHNDKGQLGIGEQTHSSIPVQVGNNTDWTKIDAGGRFTIALKTDGTLWGFGANSIGQLATATGESVLTPVQINTDVDWKTFSCGNSFVLAIKNDGTLWAWGRNLYGQIGVGEGEPFYTTPQQVGTANDWTTVSASYSSSTAIKTDGTLWRWGSTLSPPNELNLSFPTQVGTDTNWSSVSASMFMCAAIKTDGTLWGWGENEYKQIAYSDVVFTLAPIQMGTATWQSVEAGISTVHAIKSDGTLEAWGKNDNGQLGNGQIGGTTLPIVLFPPGHNLKPIAGINAFTAFLNSNGQLKMCGYNSYGNLGNGNEENNVPTPIIVNSTCNINSLQENTIAQLSVYPNPTSNLLNLANADNLNIEKLAIIDVTGKILLEQKSNTSQIDVQQLPAGMYFLEITANGTKQNTKFIKE